MKIYDVVSHRSFEIDPENINMKATKKSEAHFIYLDECPEKWDTPQAAGIIVPSEKIWKKIVSSNYSK